MQLKNSLASFSLPPEASHRPYHSDIDPRVRDTPTSVPRFDLIAVQYAQG